MKLDLLVANAIDAEPLVATRGRVLQRSPGAILAALVKARSAMGATRAVLAAALPAAGWLEGLRRAAADVAIEVRQLEAGFPLDEPTELAWELGATGPAVEVVAVTELVYQGGYAPSSAEAGRASLRAVTVTGAVARPFVGEVAAEDTVESLVARAGGATLDAWVALAGGPLRGALIDRDAAVPARAEALVVLPAAHPIVRARKLSLADQVRRALSACEACGLCTAACPPAQRGQAVAPHEAVRAIAYAAPGRSELESRALASALACTQCGLCEVVCPTGLSPRALLGGLTAALGADASVLRPAGAPAARPAAPPADGSSRRLSRELLTLRLGLAEYVRNPAWS